MKRTIGILTLLHAASGPAGDCVNDRLLFPPSEEELAKISTHPLYAFAYLSPTAVDLEKVLKKPPSADSVETRRELAEMLALQGKRTPEDVERLKSEVKNSVKTFFGPPYGSLTAAEAAALEPLFVKVRGDMNYFVQAAKKVWRRDRPFIEEPKIVPCVVFENTSSYPSGHTAASHLFALVLGELNPKRAKEMMKNADRVGADRVLAGMHHPSDIEAGKALAAAVFEKLRGNAAFRDDLKNYRLP